MPLRFWKDATSSLKSDNIWKSIYSKVTALGIIKTTKKITINNNNFLFKILVAAWRLYRRIKMANVLDNNLKKLTTPF